MLLERIVIGSDISAATYAFLSGSYFLSTAKINPLFYKKVKFRFLGHPRLDYSWSRLVLMLALEGRNLNYENINKVTVNEGLVKISTDTGAYKYKFEKCVIFDTTGLDINNELKIAIPDVYLVYDDFELANLGGRHKYLKPKITKEDFSREIHYYISSRVDGANYITDCVVESHLTKDQINDVEYSDSIARFTVERHLKSLGIDGNFMKLYKNGKPKHRRPIVRHKKRVVLQSGKNQYCDSENIKFVNYNLGDIFSEFSTPGS